MAHTFHSTTAKSLRSIRWSDDQDDTSLRPKTDITRPRRASIRPNTDSLRPNTGNRRALSGTFLPRIQASQASLREDSIPSSMLTERRLHGHVKASIGDIRKELSSQEHQEAEWGGYYGRKVRPGSRAGTGGRKPPKIPPWEISDDVKDALATLRRFREMSARSVPMISNRLINHIGVVAPSLDVTNYCRRVNFALIKDSPMLSGWIETIEDSERKVLENDDHGPPCVAISDLETAEGSMHELLDPSRQYTVIGNGVHIDGERLSTLMANIHTLSLSDNGLGDSGVVQLSAVLQRNTSLQRLCLHYNHLSDHGAGVLAGHLSHNTTLQCLRLPFNRIGDAGGEAIADMVGPCKCASVIKTAIKEGQYDVVQALLKHGHPVNPFYSDEDPLLVVAACSRGSEEVLGLLLDNGAEIEARDSKGRTAFLAAAQEGILGAIEALHLRGADVGARDKEGRSALLLAAMGGHAECAEYMVEKINECPLRLVLKVLKLRDFAFDALAQAVPPSPSHSQTGGGEGLFAHLKGGSLTMGRRPSNASQSSLDLGRRSSNASMELGRRGSNASVELGRRGSNASEEFGRRGSREMQGPPARRPSNASAEALQGGMSPEEGERLPSQSPTHAGGARSREVSRRNSYASAERSQRGSNASGEMSRRGSNASEEGLGRGSGRQSGRRSSLAAFAAIGSTEKTNAKEKRRAAMAAMRDEPTGVKEQGSMLDRIRNTGTALKKNLRKASVALENAMPGSLMRQHQADAGELFVEAFLLFRFAGTERRTERFKVSEQGTATIREVIAFQDILAGPTPLFTVDLWVIHPHSGEEQFAGMCMLSASELLIDRKPMEAEWRDVADDTGSRTSSVQLSMRIFPEMMFEESKLHERVLVEAARCGSTELVRYFAAMGADLNSTDGNGNTPLILAARDGRWEVVRTLLRSKVDITVENKAGMTALAMAERRSFDEEEGEESETRAGRDSNSEMNVVADLLQAFMKSRQGVPVSVRTWSIGQQSDSLKDPLDFLKGLYKGTYEPATLTVCVKRARNLPRADVTGLSDPFVKVTLNSQKKETKVLKRTLKPEWNEDFVFDDQTLGVWPSQELVVEVFDWNMTKAAEFLGMFKVTVAQLLRIQPKAGQERGECWFSLREKNDTLVKADRGGLKKEESKGSSSVESPQAASNFVGSARSLLGRAMSGGSAAQLVRGESAGSKAAEGDGDAEVLLSFRFDPGKGRYLQVDVIEARALPSMDGENARPNAAVYLSLFKTTVNTETVKRDSTPEWGQGFRFRMTGTDGLLEVELRELLKPAGQNSIGRVSLPLQKIMSLAECGLEDIWIELEDEEGSRLKGDDGATAAIRLRFHVESRGDHMTEEQLSSLVLNKAKQAQPKLSEETKFLLRQLTDGADPLVKTLSLFERLRAECGGFIGVEEMLEAARSLAMEPDEIVALKQRYFDQLAGSPGCSDPGHFCKLLGLGGLWERDQRERANTATSNKSGAKSFREKPEVVVNQGVQAKVGLKVVFRKSAIEEDPELERESGGGSGTIVWIDPDDADGDGQVGDIVQVRWERTGVKRDYRTGFEGIYRLAVAGTGEGSAPVKDETIIRRDIAPEVGQRVVLSKIARLLDPELRKASRDAPGTIIWIDTEDQDGDGDVGDVCEVVWDATGKKGKYNTGFQGDYRLALYEPESKISARELAGITGWHSTTILHELVLDDNLIGRFGTTQLANALRGNHTLARLSMRRNRAEAAGANALGEALKDNNTLTELRLCANMVGDDGLLQLGHALGDRAGAPIRTLDLEENGIGAIGSKYLARALIKNRTLTWLSLKNNLVGADGAAMLEQGLRRSVSLLELSLQRNVLGDSGMRALTKAFRHVPAIGKKKASAANRVLRILNVAQNNLSDDAVEFVLEGLYKNYALHTVHLHNNNISPEALEQILAALAGNVHEAKLEAGVICLQKLFRGRKERMALQAEREAAARAAKRRQLRAPSDEEVLVIEEEGDGEEDLVIEEEGEGEGEAAGREELPGVTEAEDGEEEDAAATAEGGVEAAGEEAGAEDEGQAADEGKTEEEQQEEIRLGGQSEEQNDLLLAATKAHMFNMGEALLAEQRAAEEMAKESSERVKTALENYEFLDGRLKWLLERNDTEEEELEDAARRLHDAEQEAVEAMADAEKAEEAARKCLDAMEAYHAFEREESDIAEAIKKMRSGDAGDEVEEQSPPALMKRVSKEAWIRGEGAEDGEGEEQEDPEGEGGAGVASVGNEHEADRAEGDGITETEDAGDVDHGSSISAAMSKGQSAMEQFAKLHEVLGLDNAPAPRGEGGEEGGAVEEDGGPEEVGNEERVAEMRAQVEEFNRRQEAAMAALAAVEAEVEKEVAEALALMEAASVPVASPPRTAHVLAAEELTERAKLAVQQLEEAVEHGDDAGVERALEELHQAEQAAAEAMARAESGGPDAGPLRDVASRQERLVTWTEEDHDQVEGVIERLASGDGVVQNLVSFSGSQLRDSASADTEAIDAESKLLLPNKTVDWNSEMRHAMKSQQEDQTVQGLPRRSSDPQPLEEAEATQPAQDGVSTVLKVRGETVACTREKLGAFRRVHGRILCALPSRAQRELVNAGEMPWRVAVVHRDLPGASRGAVSDVVKVERCVAAGAIAVVLVNVADELAAPCDVPPEAEAWPDEWKVPVVSIAAADADKLVSGAYIAIVERSTGSADAGPADSDDESTGVSDVDTASQSTRRANEGTEPGATPRSQSSRP